MKYATIFLVAITTAVGLVRAGAIASEQHNVNQPNLDSPALRVISDDDQATMQSIKHHIEYDFADFKTLEEVHSFIDKLRNLVQKHPVNIALAKGDLKDLHKFLSQEVVAKLYRIDTEPFKLPLGDDRIPYAQMALDDDDLTRKLFGGPLRSLVEMRRQQVSRAENGNHKDGNFFTNFWCKISGCSN